MIKRISLVRRKSTLSRDAFIEYWKGTHANIALSDKEFWSRVRRYVQNYCLPDPKDVERRPDWDGAVELWFDSLEEMNAAYASANTQSVLMADLANFIELDCTITLVTEEDVLYAGKSFV
jgi:uncharacterized protein (TIGR02118 family)